MKKLIPLAILVAVLFSSAIAINAANGKSLAEDLIKGGAKMRLDPLQDHSTALEDAARDGYIDSVKKLVNSGANINHKNKLGSTPLMLAIINANKRPDEYKEVISYLLEKGADYQIKNNNSRTAFGISMVNQENGQVYKEIADLIRKKHREMQNDQILLMKTARLKNPESPLYVEKMPKDIFNEIIKQYLEETKLE